MQTLNRIIALLEVVARSKQPATVTAVADQVDLPLPTVSRLLRFLASVGLLHRSEPTGNYMIGARLIGIARTASDPSELFDLSHSAMVALRDQTCETVTLHARSGLLRICVAQVESVHEVRRVTPLGLTLPVHVGATGAALLATGNDLAQTAKHFALTPKELRALVTRVQHVRERGWAMAVGAYLDGVSGLAVPVVGPGHTSYALSISGPSSRWTESAMRKHANGARQAANSITKRFD